MDKNNPRSPQRNGTSPANTSARKRARGTRKTSSARPSSIQNAGCVSASSGATNDVIPPTILIIEPKYQSPWEYVLPETVSLERINELANHYHELMNEVANDTFHPDAADLVDMELELEQLWSRRRQELSHRNRAWVERYVSTARRYRSLGMPRELMKAFPLIDEDD